MSPLCLYLLLITFISSLAAQSSLYPFGSGAGDAQVSVYGSAGYIFPSSPILYFGQTVSWIFIETDGVLMVGTNPGMGSVIATLQIDPSELVSGFYYYQQHTSGSVLSRATHDINQYFPSISFSASSVFVVTWDYVQTDTQQVIQFQTVLISDDVYSFLLMNYGDVAAASHSLEAGFYNMDSKTFVTIPGSNNGTNLPNLQFTSNVNVPGRWVFSVNDESTVNLLGVQLTASSLVDLTQTGNAETLLQSIKQELVSYGMTDFELNIRNVTRMKP